MFQINSSLSNFNSTCVLIAREKINVICLLKQETHIFNASLSSIEYTNVSVHTKRTPKFCSTHCQ